MGVRRRARPWRRAGRSADYAEGVAAFLQKRKPNFQKFRMRDKKMLADYLDGNARDMNAPPSMRKKK